MFYFKIALSCCLCLVFFLSFSKLTSLFCLVSCLLFHSGVAEWSFLGVTGLLSVISRQHGNNNRTSTGQGLAFTTILTKPRMLFHVSEVDFGK